jgi:hypothetical protein
MKAVEKDVKSSEHDDHELELVNLSSAKSQLFNPDMRGRFTHLFKNSIQQELEAYSSCK